MGFRFASAQGCALASIRVLGGLMLLFAHGVSRAFLCTFIRFSLGI